MLLSVNFVTNILVTVCNSTSIELYAGHKSRLVSIHHYFHTATVWELFPGKWITTVRYLKRTREFQSRYSVCRFLYPGCSRKWDTECAIVTFHTVRV